jgi:hypothetical protein
MSDDVDRTEIAAVRKNRSDLQRHRPHAVQHDRLDLGT